MLHSVIATVHLRHRPNKQQQQQQPAGGAEGAGAAGADRPALPLPPCVLAHRSKHGGPIYQLSYRLQAVETAV